MKKGLIFLSFASLLLTVLLLFPYSFTLTRAVTNVIDPLFYAWNLTHNADTTFLGMSAMLDTNIFYPLTNTLAYSDTLWAQSILASPIIWLTHNPVLAENILVILSFPLSAVCFALLAHYATKNVLASIIGGLFFAFSYPRLSQIGHLPMITSQWLPLYLLSLLKFLADGKRKDILLTAVWYILSLTSSIYFGVLLVPVTAVVIALDIIRRIRQKTLNTYKQRIWTAIPIIVPTLLLIGIALFPYIRLKLEYPNIKRSLDDVTHLRAAPIDYLSVLPTSTFVSRFLPNNTNEHALFPTFTILALALAGVAFAQRRARFFVLASVGIGLISFVFSLGNEQSFNIGSFSTGTLTLPYTWLYKLSPLFQTIRVPARFAIFVMLSLSILATYGLDAMIKRKKLFIVWTAVFIFLIEIWQTNTPMTTVPALNALPPVYTWLQQQKDPMRLAELPVSLFYHGSKMETQLNASYHDLKEHDIYALETYRMYFSSAHKKQMINGYSGFLPDSYNRLTETLENFPSDYTIETLQKIGVTHVVVHTKQYEETKRLEILKKLSSFLTLRLVYSDEHDMVYMISPRQP